MSEYLEIAQRCGGHASLVRREGRPEAEAQTARVQPGDPLPAPLLAAVVDRLKWTKRGQQILNWLLSSSCSLLYFFGSGKSSRWETICVCTRAWYYIGCAIFAKLRQSQLPTLIEISRCGVFSRAVVSFIFTNWKSWLTLYTCVNIVEAMEISDCF